jgi:hypothetical protein
MRRLRWVLAGLAAGAAALIAAWVIGSEAPFKAGPASGRPPARADDHAIRQAGEARGNGSTPQSGRGEPAEAPQHTPHHTPQDGPGGPKSEAPPRHDYALDADAWTLKSPNQEGLKATFEYARPKLQECFEEWRTVDPLLEGDIVVALTVQASNGVGEVTEVRLIQSTTANAPFDACVMSVVGETRYTAPVAPVTLEWPFQFRVPDP